MKKQYLNPEMEVIKIDTKMTILAGSVKGSSVTVSDSEEYDSEHDELF
ncbi:MAG: hypothetical protein IJ527_01730 [Prevotella sp.]|nr:hypothetical protein [Prevotella sp.]